ncbi:MAG: SEL1-like repeat protein [Deltaproteobacteria bacterium]|nr:SEL1-like repeat protein [Deltaproteobacteria bacterium]
MSKAWPLLVTAFVGCASALACSGTRSPTPPATARRSALSVAVQSSVAPSPRDPVDDMECEPAVTLSAAMRIMVAGDRLDLESLEALRADTEAAIERDARARDDIIVQQVGQAEAPEAKRRFRQVWTRYQYRCLLQEAQAECTAEVPEHACAVLVGLYQRGIGTPRAQDKAARIVEEECTRGHRGACFNIGAFFEHAARREPLYSDRADEVFTRGCARADPLSCDRLAARHEDGVGPSQRIADWRSRAGDLAEDLCDHGDPQACYDTAVRYTREGDGVPELNDRVREMYRSACSRGLATACNAIGECFEQGTCAHKALETAAAFYRRACDLNNGLGCSALGMLLEAGKGLPKSPQQAVELYARACELGSAHGCNYLCWAKVEGKAAARNLPEAAAACQKGCDRNDGNSCTLLAWFHYVGAGVERNDNRALELGTLACGGGDLAGCSNLGEMLTVLRGARRDEPRAAELFRAACDEGSESACANLGMMYEMGIVYEADRQRALQLYRRAAPSRTKSGYKLADDLWSFCSLKDPRACTLLGILNRHGIGTVHDVSRSAYFLGKGCTLGDEWGCAAMKKR